MIQLSETGEQLLPSFMFEVTGFSPYLCVSSPFSSYDNNSINFGLRFICKPCPLFCFPTVSSCSPLYSPLYHLMLHHPLLSLPLVPVIDFQNPDIPFLSGSFLQSFCIPESQVSCFLLYWRNYCFCHSPRGLFSWWHMPEGFLKATLWNSLKVFPKCFHFPH